MKADWLFIHRDDVIITIFDCRQSALQLERLTEQRRQEEEAWHRQQEQLLEAESQRRRLIALEEDKLADQRSRCVLTYV